MVGNVNGRMSKDVEGLVVILLLILLFLTRYMGPRGPWQRQSRCPLRGNGELF